MKILGILGSPHVKGSTAVLWDAVLDAAEQAGADVERVYLRKLEMKYCEGCTQCYRLGECKYDDDVEKVKAKMLAADGIVLGSPVYIWGVTAQMKTLMDRCAYLVHCQLLDGKYGAAVATAGGSGEMDVAEFQSNYLRHCGAQIVGAAGALGDGIGKVQDQEAAVARAAALGRDLAAAIAEHRVFPEQKAAHDEFFQRMKDLVTSMGDRYPAQYEHWVSRGWL